MIETAAAGLKIETRDDGKLRLKGYAAMFFRADDAGTEFRPFDDLRERFAPGAFDKTLERPQNVLALYNHNRDLVLGAMRSATLAVGVDDRGLWYRADLPDTGYARDLVEVINRGDVAGSSVGFIARDVEWREDGGQTIRELREVELFDVGPVAEPAYKATSTDVARRDFEAWRAGGTRPRAEAARRAARLERLKGACGRCPGG